MNFWNISIYKNLKFLINSNNFLILLILVEEVEKIEEEEEE